MLDIVSEPTTTTFECKPAATKAAPTEREYTNPQHAAERSNPQVCLIPSFSCSRQAVDGKNISGVTVATINNSISFGSICSELHRRRTACSDMSEVALPLSTIRRSEIPV